MSEVKQKCFSAQTLHKVENCDSMDSIYTFLSECYCHPDCFVDEALEPI